MSKLISALGVLFVLFVLYVFLSFGWGVLNMQSCSYDLPENPTCEQMAENNANNCSYVILRWKQNDYETELRKCQEWEQKNNNN